VVLPFFGADAEQAVDLLSFIIQLGGCPNHSALLVVDAAVDWTTTRQVLEASNKAFRSTSVVATEGSIQGWPNGPNEMWLKAADFCREQNQPFLWLEPDAVPMCPGWLDKIHAAYEAGKFMGHVYQPMDPKFPVNVLSAIAVYPPNAKDLVEPFIGNFPSQAWDISSIPATSAHWLHTDLIHHFWGRKDLPPTFEEKRDELSKENTRILSDIPAQAVLYHRVKDPSLIGLLRRKLGLPVPGSLLVVLPFCKFDGELMVKNLEWMNTMGMPKTHDCLLSYDQSTPKEMIARVTARARMQFVQAIPTSYPMKSAVQFPQTYAWQHAARTCHRMGRNWLWYEADCWALKPKWLLTMQAEYDRCGKPFCGPHVEPGMHCNGTAIYPFDTPLRLKRTMSHTNNAWDVEMKDEMIKDCHDCSKLWQMAWGIVNGKLEALSGEECPGFPKGSPLMNQIRPDAVLFHRCKDTSLRDRLMERLRR
jgi:hypothetical protein